jgi:hypothetical protein
MGMEKRTAHFRCYFVERVRRNDGKKAAWTGK